MTPSRSRVATVPLIAGHAALDLVNTVSWRGDPARSEDHLRSADDGLTWCVRSHVLDDDEADALRARVAADPDAGDVLVAGLRDLRGLVAASIVDAPAPRPHDAEATIVDALANSHLVLDGDRHRWEVAALDERTPRHRLALGLLELLTTAGGRLGVCADEGCRWAYLDTSKGRNRRWCSSSDCGNRDRARRHQRRHRDPRTGTSTSASDGPGGADGPS